MQKGLVLLLCGSACVARDDGPPLPSKIRAAMSARPLGSPSPVLRTPRYVVRADPDQTLPAPPWNTPEAYARVFHAAEDAWRRGANKEVRTLAVFTSFDTGTEDLFYVARANDVRGLGEGDEAEIFDDTPESALEGEVFFGSIDMLAAAGDDFFREVFLQEIAHRYGAYVRIAHPRLAPTALLGRDRAHWSYLADMGSNPLGGNRWTAMSDGRVTTEMQASLQFHPLDLYLMGVLPPDAVPAIRVYTAERHEPAAYAISATSPSAHHSGVAVILEGAHVEEITIDHVIAGSGARIPPAVDRAVVWPIGVVILTRGRAALPLDDLAAFDRRLVGLTADFEAASHGRVHLELDVPGAGRGGLGSRCSGVETCDGLVADRCAAHDEALPMCTRECGAASDCGSGFCCRRAEDDGPDLCWPASLCPRVAIRAPDSPDSGVSDAGQTKRDASPEDDDHGGSCASAPLPLLLFLTFSCRALRSRRGPRR